MTLPESRAGVVHPLRLPALQSPVVANLLTNHTDLVVELADGLGSPIHLVLPEVFEENVERLRTTFARTGAEVGIFFAKKANKADCFVRSAAALGIGVDVASSAELMGALHGGVPGDRIGISGPEKDDLLLDQAVAHGCLLALDSLTELRRVAAIAQRHERTVRVLLRSRVTGQPNSRFGMDTAERVRAVNECIALCDHVDLCGFSFHLSGYSAEQRAVAANEMIQHCLDARADGALSVDTVNIGGGLPMRYVEPEAWADFLAHNGPEQYHPAKTDRGFYFYPYGGPTTADAAETLMNHPVDEGMSLAEKVIRNDIRLMVEPGRSLLGQAGISIFRVRQIDDRSGQSGYAIVTVTGTSLNLCEQWFNTDYLPDPILLGSDDDHRETTFPACVAGSTCLENDMLTWRKIGFPRPLRAGDHLVYLNTAGYHSDFIESRFHDTPLPSKVAIRIGDGAGKPSWRLDRN